MPDFYHDAQGFLQPPNLHETDPAELQECFVTAFPDSKTRLMLYAGWKRYLAEFSKDVTPSFRQWVTGSFVTKKTDPTDIDVVNFVPAVDLKFSSDRFTDEYGSKKEFGVDGRHVPVYSAEDPFHLLTKMKTDHWLNFFTHNQTRGILAIESDHVTP